MGRGGGQTKREEEDELRHAKRGYNEAKSVGNREEEARWANTIGDIHKRRGEYVEALKWLRIDYDISVKYLPQRQVLPSCQSLGEVYLRLNRFSEALTYQKKHLLLAKESDDLVEQQRANTQLGRTYYEILRKNEYDHIAVRNAKKYFKLSMKLARNLKEKSPSEKSGFLRELIDSYNNMGMLELELDNYEDAEKLLIQGLKLCDDEEVNAYDEARTRLHHNLGNVYTALRNWNKAKGHIEKDIEICRKIRHPQGEAKGFVNLGELHSRVQKYEDAKLCYNKALQIAKCLEDEDALMEQIQGNIETVEQAAIVLEELKKDEQKLKKLIRDVSNARGTSNERKLLLEQYKWLDNLATKADKIAAWQKYKEFSKMKKRVANELCDKEKLSDSLLYIGESYLHLRNFSKARKWLNEKLEHVSLNWKLGGLLWKQTDLRRNFKPSRICITATWSDFDKIEETDKLREKIVNLKQSLNKPEARDNVSDYCSETDTEGGNASDNTLPEEENDLVASKYSDEHDDDDVTLASLVQKSRSSSKIKAPKIRSPSRNVVELCDIVEGTRTVSSRSCTNHSVGRKRVRVVLSDDEVEESHEILPSKKTSTSPADSMSISDNGANMKQK
ncbi:hypothetical protein PR202_gb10045 [Eleusine coracana subsp. coracana]|uniref:Uncharacterized protein n=1 Tax=Eleusine coracana subsp. coracana TaxID=191504 RepID=A0AAV5EJP0_ELECO|nr:hypothetical protein PR202_gb10045 [Eleusine coracana subsp. coracana]